MGIEVGGHITQDTVWSPENGPYIITSFLYVDADVTLTILPGTQVRCVGANKNTIYGFIWQCTPAVQPQAKMILVYGEIIAHGTEEQPIVFDRYQEDDNYKWGGIYIYPWIPKSSFEHCVFRNTNFCEYDQGARSTGAIDFFNGVINIRNCTFENNLTAIKTGFLRDDLLIYGCKFISENDSYPVSTGSTWFIDLWTPPSVVPEQNYKVTIANCTFTGAAVLGPEGYYMDVLYLNNTAQDFIAQDYQVLPDRSLRGSTSSYGNTSIYGSRGWRCYSPSVLDTVFARRNKILNPVGANPIIPLLILSSDGYGTNYVSDNYLYGNVQVKTYSANGPQNHFHNNIIESSYGGETLHFENTSPNYDGGQVRFYNNLVRCFGSSDSYMATVRDTGPLVYNNTIINYSSLQISFGDYHTVYSNNIIDVSSGYGQFPNGYYPMLINNCLSVPIHPQSAIYGENNIVADPIFADTLAMDYSLGDGSPCIDAGVNRPDLPDFDLRYHKRIMPGAPGTPNQVDIGAYEYNSIYIGGIEGYVYDYQSGEPVDCVRIEIQGKLPEFSDSLGAFSYPCGEGLYTVKASRWDYQDLVIPNVQVNLGEDTLLSIPLRRTNVEADDDTQSPEPLDFGLTNYPNPFNPSTTISFIVPDTGITSLSVFNIKGQRVNVLYNGLLSKGHHSFIWNGLDEMGSTVSSGVYFAKVEMNGMTQTHRMVLIK